MGIEHCSEHLIVVDLPGDVQGHTELQTVIDTVRGRDDCDVVVDFAAVDIVGSPTFSRLLELRRLLHESGRKLMLCNVAAATRGLFAVAQLEKLFHFVEDRAAALARLQVAE
jgi:anti-anti-sigma factor